MHLPLAVRQKAKDIIGFLQDDERLREARKNAKKTRDKFVGISSEDYQSRYSECPMCCVPHTHPPTTRMKLVVYLVV